MPRRCIESSDEGPLKKKNCNSSTSSLNLKQGTILKDISGKEWKLGKVVGVGGFGKIYLASNNVAHEVETDCKYVAKIESHTNGPLFVEMNCYIRIAKPEMVEAWKMKNNLAAFGMPHYVASGSHLHKGEKIRFLILPKFHTDLEKVLQEKKMLNFKSVLTISKQILEVLEYIHSKGYIHSDIKASNILLSNRKQGIVKNPERPRRYQIQRSLRSCRLPKPRKRSRNLRPQPVVNYAEDNANQEFEAEEKPTIDVCKESKCDQAYLLDYGLAAKYLNSKGEQKTADARRAHAGTILFCSRDAHKGIPSRRSDLESLGLNMVYWLTGELPWSNNPEDAEIVEKQKQRAFFNLDCFLNTCFGDCPKFIKEYFQYLQRLQFEEKPDYSYCKRLFLKGLQDYGYKNDSLFDFDKMQCGRLKQKKFKKRFNENKRIYKFIHTISRPPLQSNIPVKPLLRRKMNNLCEKKTKWFQDITDPEEILRQAREKKNSESNEVNIYDLNLKSLNPTYAMIEVYNKCLDRTDSIPTYKGDSSFENPNGYTYAMLSVLQQMKRRREIESEEMAVKVGITKSSKVVRKCIKKRKTESQIKSSMHTRFSKSATVVRKEHTRKAKSMLRRTYCLRG